MKFAKRLALCLLLARSVGSVMGQSFSSGSDGSYGAINVTSNTVLVMPSNGVFNCTTISIAQGMTLSFQKNALNTPVYLLATGDVNIAGYINVNGAGSSGSPPTGGIGGPGGFDGGLPGLDSSSVPPGAGYGPGAGGPGAGSVASNGAGAGCYGTSTSGGSSTNAGSIYGSPLLVPLVGGSGGGGTTGSPGGGGGGGGGAILIASNTKIVIPGTINANGGNGSSGAYNGGSGGAIRLVAPVVSGNGYLSANGGAAAGYGRVRIDTLDRSSLNFSVPTLTTSVGAAMFVFPSPIPRLDITQAAGTAIPVGNPGAVTIVLPFGSSSNQTVTVTGKDFKGIVPINLVLTPENGTPTIYPTQLDFTAANPASVTVSAGFAVNVRTVINAWTR